MSNVTVKGVTPKNDVTEKKDQVVNTTKKEATVEPKVEPKVEKKAPAKKKVTAKKAETKADTKKAPAKKKADTKKTGTKKKAPTKKEKEEEKKDQPLFNNPLLNQAINGSFDKLLDKKDQKAVIKDTVLTRPKQMAEDNDILEFVKDALNTITTDVGLKDVAGVYIETAEQLKPYLKYVKRLDYVVCPEIKISYNKKLKKFDTEVSLGLLAKSRATREYTIYDHKHLELADSKYDVTLDFAKVSLDNTPEARASFQTIMSGLVLDADMFKPNKLTDKVYGLNKDNVVRDLDTKRIVEDINIDGLQKYVFYFSSFSGNRNGSYVAINKYLKNEDGSDKKNPLGEKILRDVNKLVDDACLGAAKILNQTFKLEVAVNFMKNPKKYNKMMNTIPSRYAQVGTGSNDWGVMSSFAVLSFAFTIEKEQTADGMVMMSTVEGARLLSEYLTKKTGIKFHVDPAAIEGLVLQARPGESKCSVIMINPSFMRLVWQTMKGLEEGRTINGKFYTGAELRDLYGFKDYEYDSKFYTKVFGNLKDDEVPACIFDTNAIKLNWDWKRALNFEVLAICHEGDANTSIQGLNKLFAQNAQATLDVIDRLSNKAFEEANAELKKENIDCTNNSNMFTEKQWNNGVVEKIFMNNAKHGKNLAPIAIGKLAKNYMKSLENKINKLKFKLDKGLYATLQSDITALVLFERQADGTVKPISLIPKDCCYSNALTRQGVKKCMIIKHPSQGIREQMTLKVFTLDDVKDALEKLDIVRPYANFDDCIISFFKSLNDGVLMLPADSDLMKKASGLDFDFDSAIVYGDEDIVAISELIKNITVEIRSDDKMPGIEDAKAFVAKYTGINDLRK